MITVIVWKKADKEPHPYDVNLFFRIVHKVHYIFHVPVILFQNRSLCTYYPEGVIIRAPSFYWSAEISTHYFNQQD